MNIIRLGTLLLLFAACNEPRSGSGVKIVAHRGGMTERPENTLAAFKRSAELGADILELDLRISKDGQIFILHDKTLDRTTGGTGPAADLTMDELRELDAGFWFDPAYVGEEIPAFREVMQWAAGEGAVLLLDLKESGPVFAAKVAGEVQAHDAEKQVVIGVHSPEQAGEFRELLPDSRQLAFMGTPDEIEAYAEAGVDMIRLWLHWLEEDPSLAERVRDAGARLMINGTDGEPDEVRTILRFSPDWILIDDPARLIEALK